MSEKRNIYKICENEGNGYVYVTEGVIAMIAGLAATETEGVASLAGGITYDQVAKTGTKNLSKGISVDIHNGTVIIHVNLIIAYGYSVMDTCKSVQEKVKNSVANMTGLSIGEIDIKIAGVKFDDD